MIKSLNFKALQELKIGDKVTELGYGQQIDSIVNSEITVVKVKVVDKEQRQLSFTTKSSNASTIDYLFTEGSMSYCSDLYLNTGETDA